MKQEALKLSLDHRRFSVPLLVFCFLFLSAAAFSAAGRCRVLVKADVFLRGELDLQSQKRKQRKEERRYPRIRVVRKTSVTRNRKGKEIGRVVLTTKTTETKNAIITVTTKTTTVTQTTTKTTVRRKK